MSYITLDQRTNAARKHIQDSLPWFANIDWEAGGTTAYVLMTSPDNKFGTRVTVENVEDARLLVSLAKNGGGMYGSVHVIAFRDGPSGHPLSE